MEMITITLRAQIGAGVEYDDKRELRVEANRGDISKKLDAICEELETTFNY